MLSRLSHDLPSGDYAYELKWDGFRAIVSTMDGLRVRSRRGWDMTELLPELADLPPRLVLDGELIAFGEDGKPDFPRLCRRMLHGERGIPVMFVAFDLLADHGCSRMDWPYWQRRRRLDKLNLASPWCFAPEAFHAGEALLKSVKILGGRRQATHAALQTGRARLDQGQEPRLLALPARARGHAPEDWSGVRNAVALDELREDIDGEG